MKNIIFFVLMIGPMQIDAGWDWFKRKKDTKKSAIAMSTYKTAQADKKSDNQTDFARLLAEVQAIFKASQQERPYGYIPHKDK